MIGVEDAAGVAPQDLAAQGIPPLDHVFAVGQTGDVQTGGSLRGTAFRFAADDSEGQRVVNPE